MADWPVAAGNAQRTAFQATETLGTSWSVAWRAQHQIDFSPIETIHPAVGAIVSAGHVIVCSLMGRVRSYATGLTKTLQWTATVGAPIVSTPCADGTNVYVADIYGRLTAYPLSASGTNAPTWGPVQVTDGRPLQGHLLLADGKLMIGGADGTFYARDPANGGPVWSYPVGAPVIQGAAWSNATGTGTVVFGAMNGRTYGINSASGASAWPSPTTAFPWAAGFKDYWPVIVGTKVVTRPWMQLPDTGFGFNTPLRGVAVSDFLTGNQAATLASYDASPSSYMATLRVYDLATGAEQPAPIHYYWAITMHGANPPVIVDRDGYLVIPATKPASWAGSGTSCWARLDLSTRRIVDGLLDATNVGRGMGNRDENMLASACSSGVVVLHVQEGNAQFNGFFAQPSKSWYPANGGAGTTRLFVNNQGAGANSPAISGGQVYHVAHPHTLVALRAV